MSADTIRNGVGADGILYKINTLFADHPHASWGWQIVETRLRKIIVCFAFQLSLFIQAYPT